MGHCIRPTPSHITPSQGSSGTQSSVGGFRVTTPSQLSQRLSKAAAIAAGACVRSAAPSSGAAAISAAPASQGTAPRSQPRTSAQRVTSSITAMPCSTPKLIQLRGNIHSDPSDTSAAHPATCTQRRAKRGQLWPRCTATTCPMPAHSRNRLTMPVRCQVHTGSS